MLTVSRHFTVRKRLAPLKTISTNNYNHAWMASSPFCTDIYIEVYKFTKKDTKQFTQIENDIKNKS